MQILSSEQIRQWDSFTIQSQQISSVELMERAASRCVEWLERHNYSGASFIIFCGKGNNGGDGLAIARMLHAKNCHVHVVVAEYSHHSTQDFDINLERLNKTDVQIDHLRAGDQFTHIMPGAVIIDALFGSGLNRPLGSPAVQLIEHINKSGNEIISIDVPSGMFTDKSSKGHSVVKASITLSFQCYKLAFFLPENAGNFGKIHILDIGLAPAYLATIEPEYHLVDKNRVGGIYRARDLFSHKGTFGHALLIAGSFGKSGAAVLAARACLRAGAGLLTCFIPACAYDIMQMSVPEAMVLVDRETHVISSVDADQSKYSAIAIGPGLGTDEKTANALTDFLSPDTPMVLDADALNLVAKNKDLFQKITPMSVITPHPKEFERLFGSCENDLERLDLAKSKANELQLLIVLKGHNTFIATPGGRSYFNQTGNPGMATGGSGDVLTGIIAGLLAQGYTSEESALMGVYLHGLAGDISANKTSEESLIASDIIDCLGEAFREVSGIKSSNAQPVAQAGNHLS